MDQPIKENLDTPAPEVQDQPSNIAPGLDQELDAALAKQFGNQQPEVKNEPKIDVKPSEGGDKEQVKDLSKQVEAKEPAELPEVDSFDSKAPGKSSKASEGWNAIKGSYKKAKEIIKEKEAEIIKLKSGLAEKGNLSAKELEALKAENQDLARYRAMIDIQADPEFISKFDQPIEKASVTIKEMLSGMNVSKEIVDQIDFSNTKLMDEIIGHVREHRDKFVAKKLERKVEEIIDLMDKRDETLNEQKSNYKEVLEKKKTEAFSKGAEDEGKIYKHLEVIAAAKDKDGATAFPFLNKLTPKEGAAQPEVDQINNHNRMVDAMQQKITSVFKINTPEHRAEVAVAAVASHYLSAQLRAANARIKSLETEVQKISSVSSETDKSKNKVIARNGTNGKEVVDVDEAMSNFFNQVR